MKNNVLIIVQLIAALMLAKIPIAHAETDCAQVTEIPQVECEALLDFYASTNGANWKDNQGWNETNTPCRWYGISCYGGYVTRIELDSNQLSGSIPESLGNLSNLRSLELHDSFTYSGGLLFQYKNSNQLSGSIPESLGNLNNLEILDLSRNEFSGSIPESLGNLSRLERLSLSRNQLSGSIPESLGNLNHLKSLYLNNNQLSGSIPESLGNLSNLKRLYLGDNQLSGSIPESLGKLSHLKDLILDHNQLSGSFPKSLRNLSNLSSLWLNNNQLSGSIPGWLGHLNDLCWLHLEHNQFTGSIPDSLGNSSSLRFLRLNNNQLSGSIPESLGNFYLWTLSLNNNQLSGSIPESLGNLSYLWELHLENNELCGDIPPFLMEMSELGDENDFSLSNNHLTATDPELIAWLNELEPDWAATQTPCPKPKTCLVYGVHDGGLNDSQFLSIDQELAIKALGEIHFGYDIEGLDRHPIIRTLFAAAGDEPATGFDGGALYTVNKDEGTLTPHCRTDLNGISALSFHPFRHDLWAWAEGEGLFAIDTAVVEDGVCAKTKKLTSAVKVEALAWDTQGQKLYGVAGTILYQYKNGKVAKKCHHLPAKIEGLEMAMFDGNERLLFATHHKNKMAIHAFDVETCSIIDSFPLSAATEYTDIEGITLECH